MHRMLAFPVDLYLEHLGTNLNVSESISTTTLESPCPKQPLHPAITDTMKRCVANQISCKHEGGSRTQSIPSGCHSNIYALERTR